MTFTANIPNGCISAIMVRRSGESVEGLHSIVKLVLFSALASFKRIENRATALAACIAEL